MFSNIDVYVVDIAEACAQKEMPSSSQGIYVHAPARHTRQPQPQHNPFLPPLSDSTPQAQQANQSASSTNPGLQNCPPPLDPHPIRFQFLKYPNFPTRLCSPLSSHTSPTPPPPSAYFSTNHSTSPTPPSCPSSPVSLTRAYPLPLADLPHEGQ